jgi:release factor glutamine methyltransferase
MHEVKGAKIKTIDGVYAPAEDTIIAAEILQRNIDGSKLSVAEIGTGTGILGIIAAMDKRVSNVIMSDISEEALQCAKENARLNGVEKKCTLIKSNLFDSIEGNFDIIIFNPPYLPEDDEVRSGKNWWSGGPTGIELTKLFVEQAEAHLKSNGIIITVESSLADSKALHDFIDAKGFRIADSEKVHIFFEDIVALALKRKG